IGNTGSVTVASRRHTGALKHACYHRCRQQGRRGIRDPAALSHLRAQRLTSSRCGGKRARPNRTRRVLTHGSKTVKLARQTTAGADRDLAVRLRERLRYGLVTQEVLDRLARKGLVFYPYDILQESIRGISDIEVPATAGDVRVAPLGPEDVDLVANLPCRPLSPRLIAERVKQSQGFGVFINRELAGYTWVNFRKVPIPLNGGVLFELDSRGAYLFDMYIARAHRGKRFAPWLRRRCNEQLIQSGRDRIYSISLVFNSSTRRFKSR